MIIAPSAAKALPLVRIKSKSEPQGPLEALSKISKSHICFECSKNQLHFNWPRASDTGSMRAAPAILESIEIYAFSVRPVFSARTHLVSGLSLRPASTPITAIMQIALNNQLSTSSNHLFRMLPEALYLHKVSSIRCAIFASGSGFSLKGGDISMDGGLGGPLIIPRPG